MRFHRTPLTMLAVCSLLLPASFAAAQQPSEGVVQLGHRASAACDDGCLSVDDCDGCGAGNGAKGLRGWLNGKGQGHRRDGFGNGSCRYDNGYGRHGGRCGNGYGCGPNCRQCALGRLLNKCSPYHTCTFSPDHGFAPPAHRPMMPAPAMYRNTFPSSWTGQGGAADPGFRHPMVYMPTDTTQLGVYYQQVPYWRPRANMIPPVPNPAEWHTPDTGVVFTGFEDANSYGMNGCQFGEVVDQGVVDGGVESDGSESYPTYNESVEANSVPMMESNPPYSPAPVQPQMVPPVVDEAPGLPPSPSASADSDLERSAAQPLLIPVPPQ